MWHQAFKEGTCAHIYTHAHAYAHAQAHTYMHTHRRHHNQLWALQRGGRGECTMVRGEGNEMQNGMPWQSLTHDDAACVQIQRVLVPEVSSSYAEEPDPSLQKRENILVYNPPHHHLMIIATKTAHALASSPSPHNRIIDKRLKLIALACSMFIKQKIIHRWGVLANSFQK